MTPTTPPVAADGTINLIRGDGYYIADSRSIDLPNAAGTWPNLTGAAVNLVARLDAPRPVKIGPFAGTVVTPTGTGQKVRFQLTAAQTTVCLGNYSYAVEAILNGETDPVTLETGALIVSQGYAD